MLWILIGRTARFEVNVPCEVVDQYRDIPLPCPKPLWEARTRMAWQTEYAIYMSTPRSELGVFGDLIDAYKPDKALASRVDLDNWNAGTDNLGVLLNLSAAMFWY